MFNRGESREVAPQEKAASRLVLVFLFATGGYLLTQAVLVLVAVGLVSTAPLVMIMAVALTDATQQGAKDPLLMIAQLQAMAQAGEVIATAVYVFLAMLAIIIMAVGIIFWISLPRVRELPLSETVRDYIRGLHPRLQRLNLIGVAGRTGLEVRGRRLLLSMDAQTHASAEKNGADNGFRSRVIHELFHLRTLDGVSFRLLQFLGLLGDLLAALIIATAIFTLAQLGSADPVANMLIWTSILTLMFAIMRADAFNFRAVKELFADRYSALVSGGGVFALRARETPNAVFVSGHPPIIERIGFASEQQSLRPSIAAGAVLFKFALLELLATPVINYTGVVTGIGPVGMIIGEITMTILPIVAGLAFAPAIAASIPSDRRVIGVLVVAIPALLATGLAVGMLVTYWGDMMAVPQSLAGHLGRPAVELQTADKARIILFSLPIGTLIGALICVFAAFHTTSRPAPLSPPRLADAARASHPGWLSPSGLLHGFAYYTQCASLSLAVMTSLAIWLIVLALFLLYYFGIAQQFQESGMTIGTTLGAFLVIFGTISAWLNGGMSEWPQRQRTAWSILRVICVVLELALVVAVSVVLNHYNDAYNTCAEAMGGQAGWVNWMQCAAVRVTSATWSDLGATALGPTLPWIIAAMAYSTLRLLTLFTIHHLNRETAR